MKKFNDVKLLDLMMKGFKIKNDAQAALFLGITKTTINRVRHKKADLGVMQRLKLLDKIAFLGTRNIIKCILPEKLSLAVIESSDRLAHKRIKKLEGSDAELLAIIKEAFEFSTDTELANFLGLARNSVSSIRSGRTSLGPIPKLRVLNRIDSSDLAEVVNIISSTDLLSEEIENWISKNNK